VCRDAHKRCKAASWMARAAKSALRTALAHSSYTSATIGAALGDQAALRRCFSVLPEIVSILCECRDAIRRVDSAQLAHPAPHEISGPAASIRF